MMLTKGTSTHPDAHPPRDIRVGECFDPLPWYDVLLCSPHKVYLTKANHVYNTSPENLERTCNQSKINVDRDVKEAIRRALVEKFGQQEVPEITFWIGLDKVTDKDHWTNKDKRGISQENHWKPGSVQTFAVGKDLKKCYTVVEATDYCILREHERNGTRKNRSGAVADDRMVTSDEAEDEVEEVNDAAPSNESRHSRAGDSSPVRGDESMITFDTRISARMAMSLPHAQQAHSTSSLIFSEMEFTATQEFERLSLGDDETLFGRVKRCRTIQDIENMYLSKSYQMALERIMIAQHGLRSMDELIEWAKNWALALASLDHSTEEYHTAFDLNTDRKACLELLKVMHDNCQKSGTITVDEIVQFNDKHRIKRILSLCLVMDRAQCLYKMKRDGPFPVGMNWYAQKHADSDEFETGGFESWNQPTISYKYMYLYEMEELGLRGDELLDTMFQPHPRISSNP